MNPEAQASFSEDEKDILQEIMNIAFGNATADLAEVIDIYVVLSVPDIKIIGMGDLPDYIVNELDAYNKASIVEQKFWGEFGGSGVLVFPDKEERDLIAILGDSNSDSFDSKPLAALEKEILMEIGNILIGACIGKISELLSTFVTYSPPLVIKDNTEEYSSFVDSFDPDQTAIIMKTVFKFDQKDITGLLFILTNEESIEWLKKALNDFLESYE